jgi:colanic acid biosynthesis glycosyl transferase WcaI
MKITIISHNYSPEDSGIGLYSTGMAEFLANNHEVNIITGVPYYPQWKIDPNYTDNPIFSKEIINKVRVYRFKQYTPLRPTFFKRILQMVHFFLGSIFNILKIKETDITIVVMPFTLSIILGWFLKIRRGGKLWVHVQDFEFDSAFKTGFSPGNQITAKSLFKIEKWTLNRADFISTISQGMLKNLAKKSTVNPVYFPNWIDYSLINPEITLENKFLNPDTFNILYSGNIGEKQDWDFYIKLVKSLEDHPKIHFYLVGEGAKRVEVESALKSSINCSYLPPLAYDQLNDLLCNADVHVLFQKTDMLDLVMPSKLLGMMASAKPVIVTGNKDSEIKTQFEKHQLGYFFSGNDIDILKGKIIYLEAHPAKGRLVGSKARAFVIENYAIEKVLVQFEKDLMNKCGKSFLANFYL